MNNMSTNLEAGIRENDNNYNAVPEPPTKNDTEMTLNNQIDVERDPISSTTLNDEANRAVRIATSPTSLNGSSDSNNNSNNMKRGDKDKKFYSPAKFTERFNNKNISKNSDDNEQKKGSMETKLPASPTS